MQKDLITLFKDYIRECEYSRRLRHETLRGYREAFSLFQQLMPEITDPLSLNEDIMVEYFKRVQIRTRRVGRERETNGVKASTIRTYWSKLFSFFKWLLARRIIEHNPLQNLKPPNPEYTDSRALKDLDIRKIMAAITLHPISPLLLRRDYAMLYTLIFCGLRKNELISLQVSDVDLSKNELTVQGQTSKSKKTRIIPIHPTTAYHLKEYFLERNKLRYKTPALWVNSNKDIPLTNHGLKHWVVRLKELSGVKFHLHQFRHSFACALARKNVSAVKIQKLMGHIDLRMTVTYLRSLTTDDLRNDINTLSI